MTDAEDILEHAIELETREEDAYRKAAQRTADERGAAMFRYLAAQERRHRERLERQRASVAAGDGWLADDEHVSDRVKGIIEKAAKKDAVDAADVVEPDAPLERDTDDLAALKLAIESELKSIEFYAKAADNAEDEAAKKVLLKLVEEEEDHLKRLETQRFYLENHGVWADDTLP